MHGDTLELKCTIYGIPSPDIMWSKDSLNLNKSINNITDTKHENHTTTSHMFLKQLNTGDKGSYVCSGVNIAGQVKSKAIISILTG